MEKCFGDAVSCCSSGDTSISCSSGNVAEAQKVALEMLEGALAQETVLEMLQVGAPQEM